jgi:hypothetical protein
MPDTINPQKGIAVMNNNSIINIILFAVTIFKQNSGLIISCPRYIMSSSVSYKMVSTIP